MFLKPSVVLFLSLASVSVSAREEHTFHIQPIGPPASWPAAAAGINFKKFGVGRGDLSIVHSDRPVPGNERIRQLYYSPIVATSEDEDDDHKSDFWGNLSTRFGEMMLSLQFSSPDVARWNVNRQKEGIYFQSGGQQEVTRWINDADRNLMPIVEDDVHLFACAAKSDFYLRDATQMFWIPDQDCTGDHEGLIFPDAVRVNVVLNELNMIEWASNNEDA